MHAIEFDSIVQERSILLPQPMPLTPGQAVRVVVMYEETQEYAMRAEWGDAISRLAANPLLTPGFVPLSRDETHER
ncbi:MAG: hypothetical protein Q8O33_11125 [Pseudomonadota bacterium]|nr:hypothetical protein [Pseudomonadota bacterium]